MYSTTVGCMCTTHDQKPNKLIAVCITIYKLIRYQPSPPHVYACTPECHVRIRCEHLNNKPSLSGQEQMNPASYQTNEKTTHQLHTKTCKTYVKSKPSSYYT